MKAYIYTGLLAFLCFSKSDAAGNRHAGDSTLRMLYYGFIDMENIRAANAVGKKYGVSYYIAAGCIVTASLVDSINRENAATSRILASRFGEDWKTRFDAEVTATKQLYRRIEKLAEKEDYIMEKNRQQPGSDRYLSYLIEPLTAAGEYEVKAYTLAASDEGVAKIIWYKMKVDIIKSKVTLLSSKVEKQME